MLNVWLCAMRPSCFFQKVRSNIIKTENVDLYEERLKFILIFCLGKQGGGGYIFKILK